MVFSFDNYNILKNNNNTKNKGFINMKLSQLILLLSSIGMALVFGKKIQTLLTYTKY